MRKILSIFAAMLVAVAVNAAIVNITSETPDALRLALYNSTAGDTIVMAAGTYVESPDDYIAWKRDNVVMAAEGADVIIKPHVSFRVKGGSKAELIGVKIDASEITSINNWYENIFEAGDANDGNEWILNKCEIYGNIAKTTMRLASDKKVDAITIKDCYIHNNPQAILRLQSASLQSLTIQNSTFAEIANGGSFWCAPISVEAGTNLNVVVDHCTFYHVTSISSSYADVTVTAAGANVTVSNCIIAQPEAYAGSRAVNLENIGGVVKNSLVYNYTKSTNGIQGATSVDNCIYVDPLFVDAANADYTLGEGSPALTAATDGGAIGDPRWAPAAPEAGDPKAIYLKPTSVWSGDGAKFGVYAFQNGLPEYFSEVMTLAENETDIYTTTIPENYYNVVFMRLNDGADHVAWDQIWNQSVDLAIPEGMNMFTVTGWNGEDPNKGVGDWSLYEHVVPAKFYITGDENLVGADKAWSADAIKVTEDAYTFENLPAGNYKLKVVVNDAWKGFEALTVDQRTAELYPDQDGNVCFVLAEAGNVVVTYTEEVFKVEGAFVPATVALIGINGWDAETEAIALTPADDHLTASVTLNLTEWYYEFKVLLEGAWLGKEHGEEGKYTIHSGWTSVDALTYAGDNIILSMGDGDIVPGNYTFTWIYAEGKLTVTFPGGESAINNVEAAAQVVKMVENGQLVIIKNGVKYNAQGAMLK